MDNWQDKLLELEKQLNQKEGKTNVRNNSSDYGNRSGGIYRVQNIEEKRNSITNVERSKTSMITIEDALADIKAIGESKTLSDVGKIVSCFGVMLKFISTMRTNQLLTEEDKKKIKEEKEKNRKK